MRASGVLRLVLWLLLAIASLLASWACVNTAEIELHYSQSRFNDRIAADLGPLVDTEVRTDMCYGLFRDGSVAPEEAEERKRGLVSEIYPVAAADPTGPGNLVQTPCLFVGRDGTNGDELNVAWEVVATLVPEKDSFLDQLIDPRFAEVGICTMSGPVSRLMFEDPDYSQYRGTIDRCTSEGGAVSWTLNTDHPEMNKNVRNSCRWDERATVRLERFPVRGTNADGVCPALNPAALHCGTDNFDGSPVAVNVRGCMTDRVTGLLSGCALPCGFTPSGDASYRVSVDPNNPIRLPVAQRFLNPNVLVVNRARSVVRPMTSSAPTPTAFSWHTAVLGSPEGAIRWAENFSPTVRVETVQIISRDLAGGTEKVETPELKRLNITIPMAAGTAPVLQCTGTNNPGEGVTFTIAACTSSNDDPAPANARPLTPTYAISNLHIDPPLDSPVTWQATLANFPADRRAFIKFGLRTQIMAPAIKVTPMHNFGRIPKTEYRQGTLEIENIGGETMSITKMELAAGVGQPQDFSFFALDDPVAVPLPIDAKSMSNGNITLSLGDLRETPVVTVNQRSDSVEVRLGNPAAAPGTPQAFTVYNQRTLLRGAYLTRDDANSVFNPSTSYPRPFVMAGYVEKRTPFSIRPGERVKIAVETRPSAFGLRLATLRITAVPDSNPTLKQELASQLVVDVVSGPLLNYLPYSQSITEDHNGSQPGHRTGVLENVGHFDLTIHSLQITGPGAARFAITTDRGGLGPFVLPPGDFVTYRVEHLPLCNGNYGNPHQGTLLVTSNGGNASIPLAGYSQRFCVP